MVNVPLPSLTAGQGDFLFQTSRSILRLTILDFTAELPPTGKKPGPKSREATMLFLMTAEWAPAAAKALIENPTDRSVNAKQATEAAGGKLIAWYGTTGGERQGMAAIVDMPDGIAIQALYLTGRASGALEGFKIQRLYTPDEMVQAFRKAQEMQGAYAPPG
jgi:uncharacterized protein with GYD domain